MIQRFMGLGEFSWVGIMWFPWSAYICNHDIHSVVSLHNMCKKCNLNRTWVQGCTFESIAENVHQICEQFLFHGVKAIWQNLQEQHQDHVPRLLYITLYPCSWRYEGQRMRWEWAHVGCWHPTRYGCPWVTVWWGSGTIGCEEPGSSPQWFDLKSNGLAHMKDEMMGSRR